MDGLKKRTPNETEFHQSVYEISKSIYPLVMANPQYSQFRILERMVEPDRTILFKVIWEDDKKNIRINRGYRVQFNNAIGPYKGGLRFHPSVNLSIIKFLGFEQIFKNSLTTLPMGSGKGGSDFNPYGKSDMEVMRFCISFMTELSKHIGPERDIPAGDIGVGKREISFLYGQYKKITGCFHGAITGKSIEYGGSLIRTEATGYGCAYFMENMLNRLGQTIKGKTCIVSGSGNVAQYCVEKILQLGGKVVSMSDSSGCFYDPNGIDVEKLNYVIYLKNVERGRIHKYADKYQCDMLYDQKPWHIPCDLAFPCATQNEISEDDAKTLVKNGCIGVAEGANMPTVIPAIDVFILAKIAFAPGKASNAGGVAISGLEMTQNTMHLSWSREKLENELISIMKKIHEQCVQYGLQKDGYVNYVYGANIAGFIKVANSMLSYGVMG